MDLSHIVHGLKPKVETRANSPPHARSRPSSPQPRQAVSSSSSAAPRPAAARTACVPSHSNQVGRSASSRAPADHSPSQPAPTAVGSASGSVLTCDKCPRTFASRVQFDQHISVFHARSRVPSRQREANFVCSYCGKKFTSPSKRTLHVNATHMGLKPYQCETCSKSFGYKGDLGKHRVSHSGEKPYSCYICGAKFARNFYVKRHIETIHEKKNGSSSL